MSVFSPNDVPIVLILAAGAGRRFRVSGGATHKLDAVIAGTTVLAHVAESAQRSGLPVHVVGHAAGSGMGDSIAAGVAATPGARGWLILPGDLPAIRTESILAVARALEHDSVVVPHWQGEAGHPVGFKRECGPALAALTGDKGAAAIVRMHRSRGEVHDLELNDRGIVMDVDTVDDLARVEAYMRQRHTCT